MAKKDEADQKIVIPDGKDIVQGISIFSFLHETKKGVKLNVDWSDYIVDEHGTYQIASLNGWHFGAWKFQRDSKLMVFFPCGAMILVIDGKLLVADKLRPSESLTAQDGEQIFGFPMTFLAPFEIKLIAKKTWVNLASDDMETTFLIHNPDGFRLAGKPD